MVVVVLVGGVGSTGGDCAGGGDTNVINMSSGKLLPLTSGETKSVDEKEKSTKTRPIKRGRRKRRKSNMHTFPLRTHQQKR